MFMAPSRAAVNAVVFDSVCRGVSWSDGTAMLKSASMPATGASSGNVRPAPSRRIVGTLRLPTSGRLGPRIDVLPMPGVPRLCLLDHPGPAVRRRRELISLFRCFYSPARTWLSAPTACPFASSRSFLVPAVSPSSPPLFASSHFHFTSSSSFLVLPLIF